MRPTVVVHGGAGTVDPALLALAPEGVSRAAEAGRQVLNEGGDCIAAAVAAVRVLEDDPAFNAGRGSCMNEAGEFEADAAVMRAEGLRSGAVAAVANVADAVEIARAVMEDGRHILLAGEGAAAFARAKGVGRFGREGVWTEKADRRRADALEGKTAKDNRADTVGAVVLDAQGGIGVASSTGGVLLKRPGRVGDTPLIGAGFYACPWGGMVATGVGEVIATHLSCSTILWTARAEQISLQEAAERHCREVHASTQAALGVIGIAPDGEFVIAHASEHMSWGLCVGEDPVCSGLTQAACPRP